jgi:hypothetical protein
MLLKSIQTVVNKTKGQIDLVILFGVSQLVNSLLKTLPTLISLNFYCLLQSKQGITWFCVFCSLCFQFRILVVIEECVKSDNALSFPFFFPTITTFYY